MYEYKVFYDYTGTLEEFLNEVAKDGWRYIGPLLVYNNITALVFERKIIKSGFVPA